MKKAQRDRLAKRASETWTRNAIPQVDGWHWFMSSVQDDEGIGSDHIMGNLAMVAFPVLVTEGEVFYGDKLLEPEFFDDFPLYLFIGPIGVPDPSPSEIARLIREADLESAQAPSLYN